MDFNQELNNLLKDNQILGYKRVEEIEYDYFTVIFHKHNKEYHTPSNQPLLKKVILVEPFSKDGLMIVNELQFQHLKELLKLEQANVIVRIIDKNVN